MEKDSYEDLYQRLLFFSNDEYNSTTTDDPSKLSLNFSFHSNFIVKVNSPIFFNVNSTTDISSLLQKVIDNPPEYARSPEYMTPENRPTNEFPNTETSYNKRVLADRLLTLQKR